MKNSKQMVALSAALLLGGTSDAQTPARGAGTADRSQDIVIDVHSHGESEVIMDGGTLTLQWGGASAHLFMTGPAETVFEGMVEVGSEYATEAGQTATD